MSCCGSQREKYQGTAQTQQNPSIGNKGAAAFRAGVDPNAYFQYMGQTGLSVVGSATGKRYRFDYAGAIIAVHASDRRSLVSVPKLRQVRRP